MVRFQVNPQNAPYVETKPLHKSQRIVERLKNGDIIFEIKVVINQELQREIFGFAEGIKVLSPPSLVHFMASKLRSATKLYDEKE